MGLLKVDTENLAKLTCIGVSCKEYPAVQNYPAFKTGQVVHNYS